MKPVARNEVLGLAEYEEIREPFRSRVIAEKRGRRVALGPQASCLFIFWCVSQKGFWNLAQLEFCPRFCIS